MDDSIENEKLVKFFRENVEKEPSFDFTDKVLRKASLIVEEKKIIQPLIGKSTWLMLLALFFVLLIVSFFQNKNVSLSAGINNLQGYLESILISVNSYWFYIVFGLIVTWELVFRKRLQLV